MIAGIISTNMGIIKKIGGLAFTWKFLKEFHEKFEQFKNIKSTKGKSEKKNFANNSAWDKKGRKVSVLSTILVIHFLMIMNIKIILFKK